MLDFEALKHSPDFVIKHFKDSHYIGEIDPGKNVRAGLGVCIYENTRLYEGSWKADKRHGKGYERFSNGNQYLGDYDMGKVQGKGLYTWANMDTYDGEWLAG